MFVKSFKEMRK